MYCGEVLGRRRRMPVGVHCKWVDQARDVRNDVFAVLLGVEDLGSTFRRSSAAKGRFLLSVSKHLDIVVIHVGGKD
jgi:hypothetical protein